MPTANICQQPTYTNTYQFIIIHTKIYTTIYQQIPTHTIKIEQKIADLRRSQSALRGTSLSPEFNQVPAVRNWGKCNGPELQSYVYIYIHMYIIRCIEWADNGEITN